MKKFYETPVAEKVIFQYQEQVTASGTVCYVTSIAAPGGVCNGDAQYTQNY